MSGGLDKAQNSLQKIGGSLTSIGSKMTAGITLPLVGAGVAMFKTFSDFESVITELGARTGATADEMKKMSDFALQMGRDTAFSATEAAQALLELTSSGSSAAEAMEMLPQVLDLAAAGALELGAAADGVTDIMAQFQLEAKDSTTIVDSLAKAAGASSASVEDLVAAFGNVGPVAAQFGLSVEETAAALATLSENGIKGAESGTALKSMLLNMTRNTEPVAEAWGKLGVSMFDAAGEMRNIDDVFKDINKAMEGMSTEEQISLSQDLAGSYGIVGFNALRASNGISDMQAAMLGAASASEVADARMNTLAGKWDSLMGSLETLGIVLGGLGKGPLLWLIEGLTNVINKVSEWAQANPRLAQIVMVILAIVAALGPLLIIIGSIVGAIGTISAAITAVGGAAAIAGGAMAFLTGPIGWLIGAGALLFAAWQTDFAGIRTLLTGLGAYVGGFVDTVRQQFELAKSTGVGFFEVFEDGSTRVGAILQSLGVEEERATKMGQNFVRNVDIMKKNFEMMGTIISQVGQRIAQGWENVKQKFMSSTFVQSMKDFGVRIIQGLIEGIKSGLTSLLGTLKSMVGGVVNAVKGALQIQSPSRVMMDIGRNVVEGFNMGIESAGGLRTPAIAGVTAGGGRGGSGGGRAATVTTGGGGGRGGVYIQNMNVPPGTTREQAAEISRIIARETKRRGGSSSR